MLRRLAALSLLCAWLAGHVLAAGAAPAAPIEPLLAAMRLTPLVGQAPAALALERLADGKQVTLASLRGRPVILYFWATW